MEGSWRQYVTLNSPIDKDKYCIVLLTYIILKKQNKYKKKKTQIIHTENILVVASQG